MKEFDVTHLSAECSRASTAAVVNDNPPAMSLGELLAGLRRALSNALQTLSEWHERARQRRHLMELDDRMLKDIGLSRAAVHAEWRKRFWEL